ncbi:MAG: cbb3-type cytochrome c oxidase subunit 3 [Sphingomonadaceae bacterium]
MTFYETFRHFADTYWLAVMFVLFLILCLWPFRPGSKHRNSAAAHSIFKDNDDGE